MQLARKRLGAFALAVCLLVALAVGAVSAFAVENWQGDGFEGSLTVTATADGDDAEAIATDIAKADVVVDIYRVATVAKDPTYDTYNYTWVDGFGTGAIDTSSLKADDWQQMANEAASHIANGNYVRGALDAPITQLDDGLYLVIAHGSTKEAVGAEKLIADSPTYEYTFQLALVSIPTKEGGNTASPEPWTRDANVNLKFERDPRYGDIKINKTRPNQQPSRNAVSTGDDTNLFPFYVAMSVSGILLALIAAYAVITRRRAREARAGGRHRA